MFQPILTFGSVWAIDADAATAKTRAARTTHALLLIHRMGFPSGREAGGPAHRSPLDDRRALLPTSSAREHSATSMILIVAECPVELQGVWIRTRLRFRDLPMRDGP